MTRIAMEGKILNENQRIAAELRERYEANGLLTLNLISSPGAGKTSLLEKTLQRFDRARRVALLTGDIQTDLDAGRLARFGFPVRQITTSGACHLDAKMVERALDGWDLGTLELLLIENVGNLVCPSSFDLGEESKIVVFSVAEGEEKPLKYPGTFARAELVIINKIDLLGHVPFDIEKARENTERSNPGVRVIELSCTTGDGIAEWESWIEEKLGAKRDLTAVVH
ncbi:MAG: hydrogenase nickel incorporation protein HypB [Thermoanaerobaculia bacterium]